MGDRTYSIFLPLNAAPASKAWSVYYRSPTNETAPFVVQAYVHDAEIPFFGFVHERSDQDQPARTSFAIRSTTHPEHDGPTEVCHLGIP